MINALKQLVKSFDDDEGLPKLAYEATYQIIERTLGLKQAVSFAMFVDATNDRFYIKSSAIEQALLSIFG